MQVATRRRLTASSLVVWAVEHSVPGRLELVQVVVMVVVEVVEGSGVELLPVVYLAICLAHHRPVNIAAIRTSTLVPTAGVLIPMAGVLLLLAGVLPGGLDRRGGHQEGQVPVVETLAAAALLQGRLLVIKRSDIV